ncbi:fused MFS/spermidine synthase [Chloroflexus sp.]|uniref:spermidine synthase n=1 Tax=Chloroflexus sp. TaxID=1904827 RepID=UPI00298F2C38|nr:fused MFS/spermidine synthase [Chloroflexus sp.]MCS6888072.1 fused MFS/spermidine synthase [Chloroflexus sp.]MDW8402781.1 fused MFS/spermidine synthase [Chloroflexus sp.]
MADKTVQITERPGVNDRLLLAVVFLAGIGTLGIEMVMPRMLAPFFGTSQPIWAVVIGMTLVYLAVGYRLGGTLADRRPDWRLLFQLIGWAGLSCAIIPFVARPILSVAQGALRNVAAGGFLAALIGVILLFAVPVTLMAMVGPFAIRLQMRHAEDVERAGRTAGTISALSTIGSIIGTFLTVLVLIPAIGVASTLFLFAGFLVVLSLIGLRDPRGLLLVATVALLAAVYQLNTGVIKAADCRNCRLIAEFESDYNYIQVAEQEVTYASGAVDRRRVLILNEGLALHSIYRLKYRETGDPLDLLTDGGPWDYFTVAPYLYPNTNPDDVRSLALLGAAAGSIAQQFLAIYGPDTIIDAVEIDRKISEVGRRYFDMADGTAQAPYFTTYNDDARHWLTRTDRQYDVIGMDAYHQPYIPFHLTTVEFFQEVKAKLTPRGVAVVNAGRPASGDDRLVNALASTMIAVFPQVYIIDTRFSNAILIGVNQPVGDGVINFIENAARIDVPALQLVMYWSLYEGKFGPLREFTPAMAQFRPFTDDHAPVEQLIDGLIFSEAGRIAQ